VLFDSFLSVLLTDLRHGSVIRKNASRKTEIVRFRRLTMCHFLIETEEDKSSTKKLFIMVHIIIWGDLKFSEMKM
jgi:hypothetical protein